MPSGSADVQPLDEAHLLTRLRTGDVSAFECMYRTYHPRLWDFAYRYLHTEAIASEVVHDVFLALWNTRVTLEVRDGLQAYLFGAVRNRAVRLRGREATEERILQRHGHAMSGASAPRPDDMAADAHLDAAVDRVLAQLPERTANILFFRWKYAMSYSEIATALGMTPEAAQKRGRRAIEQLRPLLAPLADELGSDV
jgi:RNA polymerase sigma-70 factor (ECF subfamily)